MVSRIDRGALVAKHSPHYHAVNPTAPLSVGNGEFCFTTDVTGLQTFPTDYSVDSDAGSTPGTLLGTLSQWAWHSTSAPPYDVNESYRFYETAQGSVPYVDLGNNSSIHDQHGESPAEEWLRNNPHRLDLGRVGLWTGSQPDIEKLGNIDQTLDLGAGILSSRFVLDGRQMDVRTAAHPDCDAIGVLIETADGGEVGVRLRFPYGSEDWGNAADWDAPDRHRTTITTVDQGWCLKRTIDDTSYSIRITAPAAELVRLAEHDIVVQSSGRLQVTIEFSGGNCGNGMIQPGPLRASQVHTATTAHWQKFWATGGAIDFSESDDSRAHELERRVILSQYLTAIQCAGSTPPAETGLTMNSWRGKFHVEMHWWHAAHFPLWGRPELLERSLPWYEMCWHGPRRPRVHRGMWVRAGPNRWDPTVAKRPAISVRSWSGSSRIPSILPSWCIDHDETDRPSNAGRRSSSRPPPSWRRSQLPVKWALNSARRLPSEGLGHNGGTAWLV
ncbi:MAG: hypothetical protein JWQ64_3436 [Subtercola sp.]|nr:hypothetical protein [Subtercola sp.]